MKVIVVGCHGQMGQPICRFVDEREGMELVGGVGPAGRDYIGRDLGQVAGLGRDLGIPVVDDLASIIGECDALIDVSSVASRPSSSSASRRRARVSPSSSNATPPRW